MRSLRGPIIGVFAAIELGVGLTSLGSARAGEAGQPAVDLARGAHIATALAGCADCHGATFAGGTPFRRGGVTVYSSNLTGGAGGVAAYSDADLRRAIRGGVRPDGTQLYVMPSREYAVMTDADVDDVIAFLRSLPPVDHVVARATAPPASTTTTSAPAPAGSAVEAQPPSKPPSGGAYLATIGGCTNCHGANLAGTVRFGVTTPNISRDGIGKWTFADFTTAMRTGQTPDGHTLSKAMPWETVGKMTDAELRAVYDFLESQPAQTN